MLKLSLTSKHPRIIRGSWMWIPQYAQSAFGWRYVNQLNFYTYIHIYTYSGPNPRSFSHFWLGNLLRATTACTFSTSQRPKVVRTWCALYVLTWKCASRQNGVHFFDITTPKSGPNLVCFVHFDFEMCFAPQRRATFHLSSAAALASLLFDPPEPQIVEQLSESRLSYLFAHLHLLSSLIFSFLFFSSLTLPTSALPTVHIVGSFTSKLPSVTDIAWCLERV